jgi:hypothetical protein
MAAAGAGEALLLPETALEELVPGLVGLAPFSRPWDEGTR